MTLFIFSISNEGMDVVAAILVQKQKLLLTRRPQEKNLGDSWEFPGGKVQSGESLEEALVRELREELKVQVNKSELQYIGEVKSPNITLHFLMTPLKEPYLPQEHPATCWLALESLSKKELCPLDKKASQEFSQLIQEKILTL